MARARFKARASVSSKMPSSLRKSRKSLPRWILLFMALELHVSEMIHKSMPITLGLRSRTWTQIRRTVGDEKIKSFSQLLIGGFKSGDERPMVGGEAPIWQREHVRFVGHPFALHAWA